MRGLKGRGRHPQALEVQHAHPGYVRRHHHPDTNGKVAAALCKGGPVAYFVKKGYRVMGDWIRTHIVPNSAEVYIPKTGGHGPWQNRFVEGLQNLGE